MPPRPHMRDEAQIGTLTEVTSGFEPKQDFVYGGVVRCRLVRVTSTETVDGKVRKSTSVQVHFRAGETIDETSRIRITRRNRTILLTPEYYDIVGEPWETKGNRTIVCDCANVPIGVE